MVKPKESLRGVNQRLCDHPGQFVLAVEKTVREYDTIKYAFSGGILPPRDTHLFIDTTLYLGTICGQELTSDKAGRIFLPTSASVKCQLNIWTPEPAVELVKGKLTFPALARLASELGVPLSEPAIRYRRSSEGPDLKLDLRIGDQEVNDWFEKEDQGRHLLLFNQMARLLGRPIPPFPALTEAISRRAEEIVRELCSLISKRYQLKRDKGSARRLEELGKAIDQQAAAARELGLEDKVIIKRVWDELGAPIPLRI